jgi:3-deoxy-7-phosphoheptulonate synthase
VTTAGNADTHVILRGGRSGPNYSSSHVSKALDLITAAGLPRRIMVDASHGNSGKDHRRQMSVADSLAGQLGGGERGLVGVMLESFLVAGRQEPGDPATLTYGQSVTDACMDIEMTAAALETLAASAAGRRQSAAELSGTDRADSVRHPPLARTSTAPEHPRVASGGSRELMVTMGCQYATLCY